MNELDQFWSREIALALENARSSGRGDVADYLELRARNDAVREIGIRWLVESLIVISAEANRGRANIDIVREEPHRFDMFRATMAGLLLKLQQGVRCLTLEAGWTRTPSDGFMRGGTLAAARITHFGMPKAGSELGLLFRNEEPVWHEFIEEKPAAAFSLEHLERHFRLFTG